MVTVLGLDRSCCSHNEADSDPTTHEDLGQVCVHTHFTPRHLGLLRRYRKQGIRLAIYYLVALHPSNI